MKLVFSAHDVDRIVGTLWTPSEQPQPLPLAVWVHGSSPQARNGIGPYRDVLLKAGLAVFSWDKPGVGASGGKFADFPLENRREEVRKALALVRTRPEIDVTRIGLIGGSQAGAVLPPVAVEDAGVAFLIAVSPLTLPFSDRYAYESGGFSQIMQKLGMSKQAAEAVDRLYHVTVFGVIERRGSAEEVRQAARVFQTEHGSEPGVSKLVRTGWLKFAHPEQYTDEEHSLLSEALTYDVRPTIASIRCPSLYLFGSADNLLNPATSSVAVAKALREGNNPDHAVIVFPEADHALFVPGSNGGKPHFVPGLEEILTTWIEKRTRRVAPTGQTK